MYMTQCASLKAAGFDKKQLKKYIYTTIITDKNIW